ncbi:hypothetical protein PR202_gb01192 [Eleusine coracana subsp. coracana]|uniref:Leucine-rich repeat-containing N-terminal plant-type domain-containing protein n=1 Tax=Eleusine coracana subsp. coracana TaxID=191504 RepID=A0AAV5DVL5_ELECO|nr:hypothetical protein PR202_gb01192 [Eleusine coracana subsp. coracana]
MRASSLVEHRVTVAVAVLLAAAAAAAAARTKNECHSGDKAALLSIKSAFGNASYFNSWTPDTPCCEWANVACDSSSSSSSSTARRVVAVSFLDDAGLAGPLPGAAIARLTALQQLVLSNVPGVNGTIPHNLTRLSPPHSASSPSHLSRASPGPATRTYTSPTTGSPAAFREFAAVNFWTLDSLAQRLSPATLVPVGANKPLENLDLSSNGFSFNLSAVQLRENLNSFGAEPQ